MPTVVVYKCLCGNTNHGAAHDDEEEGCDHLDNNVRSLAQIMLGFESCTNVSTHIV